ncbi:MAG: response regulator [Elusimicrobiota bacterium]|jgi:CheY-like chemotaxis protein
MARVLIVDDDVSLVQILTLALRSFGHEVASAGDPSAGLQEARQFKPEIVLLDYHMPGATGSHLFEAFRRNASTAKIPILFMSGEASPDQVFGEVAEASHTRFLAKPVRMEELRRSIAEMLAEAADPE